MIVVKPMVAAYHGTTAHLAYFLQQLLRPLIQHGLRRTFFINEIDFIDRLNQYTNVEHRLKPNTFLATITLTKDFPLNLTHTTLIEHIKFFLQFHLVNHRLEYTSMLTGRTHNITISTCIHLIELFLEHNRFYYENKIYTFAKGAPNCFILTELLSIMYLSIWQRFLLDDSRIAGEFLGSYQNQTILTWNGSMQEFHQMIRSITERCPQMPLQSSIGKSIQFMNIHLENRQGQLYTNVYHGSSSIFTHLTLPYVIDHPKLEHRHWFHSALIRAVRCCSQVDDFIHERIRLEMSYLTAGYSRESLETLLNDFYRYFNWNVLRFRCDSTTYDTLRQAMFKFIEKQQIETTKIEKNMANNRLIHLHYLFDQGPLRLFHDKFFEIWSKYLQHDDHLSLQKSQILLTGKQIYSLNSLLINDQPKNNAHLMTNTDQ